MPVDQKLKLQIYSGGVEFTECEVEAGFAGVSRIADWLDGHQVGWGKSQASYVPRLIIRGSDFTLNFLGDGVILNHERGQFTRAIDPAVYKNLTCADL